jgi:hypothetical protein
MRRSHLRQDTCWRYYVQSAEQPTTDKPHSQDARIGAMHMFSEEILLQRSFAVRVVFQCLVLDRKSAKDRPRFSELTRYAEKAPGLVKIVSSRCCSGQTTYNTVIHPNADSNGLSRILLILYSTAHPLVTVHKRNRNNSQFCAATSGLNKLRQ